MAYFSTEPASERRNVTEKSRVRFFFRLSNETHPANRRQPAQPRRKTRPTPTKGASGIPYWPSRDPIGERGGKNLYGFLKNCGVRKVDRLGLAFIFPNLRPGGIPGEEPTGVVPGNPAWEILTGEGIQYPDNDIDWDPILGWEPDIGDDSGAGEGPVAGVSPGAGEQPTEPSQSAGKTNIVPLNFHGLCPCLEETKRIALDGFEGCSKLTGQAQVQCRLEVQRMYDMNGDDCINYWGNGLRGGGSLTLEQMKDYWPNSPNPVINPIKK